jgi:threonine dehydratase
VTLPISYDDIVAARERLRPFFDASPVRHYPQLDELVGYDIRVLVKHENHLPTGSFKVRNGTASITALSPEQAAQGVIAATTGNHGLGLAWAGAARGVGVTICVPTGNNPEKNAGIRALGATLIEVGERYDETVAACRAIAEQEQRTIVHSTNHLPVIAGAGTMSDQYLTQAPELDALVIALGGGSQAVGALTVANARKASLAVYAVQSQGAPAQHNAWHDGEARAGVPAHTFAEGIATGSTYAMTYPALRTGLRDFVLASEAMIAQSVRDLWRITHNLPEGAGAAGLAGLRLLAPQLAGKTVGLVMCGGNLDAERAAHILLGGMPHFPSGTDEGQAIGGRGPSHRLPSSS